MNIKPLSIALAVAAALALGACSEQTEQEARETGAALDEAAARVAADEVAEATEDAQDAMETGVNEAAEELDENITTDAEATDGDD